MTIDFAAAMRRALGAARASNPGAATRIIQQALAGRGGPEADASNAPRPGDTLLLDHADAAVSAAPPAVAVPGTAGRSVFQRLRRPLGEVLEALRGARRAFAPSPAPGQPDPAPQTPQGAQFLARSFTCAAGGRGYKLFVPADTPQPRGLIVMLHGCTQNPDDFAVGTKMNAVAQAHGLLVAYPAQTRTANVSACWNWFNPADQKRDAGEPAIIAGITRALMAEFSLGADSVFVAGLSAGGAMAAVMGETYPDLYAGVGVHSGLACGSANDVISALAAMRGGAGLAFRADPPAARPNARIRTIIFHGSADKTVNPSNASRVAAAAAPLSATTSARQTQGRAAGGRGYSRTITPGDDGAAHVEVWLIDGAGHAWSGGDPAGTYTDASGPAAAAEMARFFLRLPEPPRP